MRPDHPAEGALLGTPRVLITQQKGLCWALDAVLLGTRCGSAGHSMRSDHPAEGVLLGTRCGSAGHSMASDHPADPGWAATRCGSRAHRPQVGQSLDAVRVSSRLGFGSHSAGFVCPADRGLVATRCGSGCTADLGWSRFGPVRVATDPESRPRTQARARSSPGITLGNREIPRPTIPSLLGLLSVPACSSASTPLRFAARRLRRCGAAFGRLQG